MKKIILILFILFAFAISCKKQPLNSAESLGTNSQTQSNNNSDVELNNFSQPGLEKDLVLAAKIGNLDKVKNLLEQGVNPDSALDGVPALIWATYNNHYEIVKALLEKGADVNIRDKDGDTPLIVASFTRNIKLVKLFYEEFDADIMVQSKSAKTALGSAKEKAHKIIVDFLTAKINKQNQLNANVHNEELIQAVAENNIEKVKKAINAGAYLNYFNNPPVGCGKRYCRFLGSPLADALWAGRIEIAKLLIEKGVNINTQVNKIYPIEFASDRGFIKIVELMLKKSPREISKKKALYVAAEMGHLEIIKLFERYGINIKQKFEGGRTLLHQVCAGYWSDINNGNIFENHFKTVQYLLGKNLNVNSRDKNGNTPLMCAAERGCPGNYISDRPVDMTSIRLKIVKLLVEKGADVNARNKKNESVLKFAKAPCGQASNAPPLNDALVQFLIKSGAKE